MTIWSVLGALYVMYVCVVIMFILVVAFVYLLIRLLKGVKTVQGGSPSTNETPKVAAQVKEVYDGKTSELAYTIRDNAVCYKDTNEVTYTIRGNKIYRGKSGKLLYEIRGLDIYDVYTCTNVYWIRDDHTNTYIMDWRSGKTAYYMYD